MWPLWKKINLKGGLIYPDEFVARFLAMEQNASLAALNSSNLSQNSTQNEPQNSAENPAQPRSGLDFGCGLGRHLGAMINYGLNEITGLELDDEQLKTAELILGEQAKARGVKLNLINSSNLSLKTALNGAKFDIIIAWGIFMLYPKKDALKILKTFKAHLKPGGKICINFRGPKNTIKKTAIKQKNGLFKPRLKGYENLNYYFYTAKKIAKLLKNAGLEIKSLDRQIFTKNNKETTHDFYQIIAIHNS